MQNNSFDSPIQPGQMCIVSPPVVTMSVPVLRNPAESYQVIAQLKAGTVIQVVDRTELWLRIRLPGEQVGFIQAKFARPATWGEMASLQGTDARSTPARSGGPIIPLQRGMIAVHRPVNYKLATSLIGIGVFACVLSLVIGMTLGGHCSGPASNATCVEIDPGWTEVSIWLVRLAVASVVAGIIAAAVLFMRAQRS